MIRAASSNSSVNGLIRRGQQQQHSNSELRTNNERTRFRRPQIIQHFKRKSTRSLQSIELSPRIDSSQSALLSRFGWRDDDDDLTIDDGDDEIVQTIDEQHVISHPRLPPGTGR